MYNGVLYSIPLIIISIGLIFNSYLAFESTRGVTPERNMKELWTTRENSYGHPYYWKIRHCEDKQPTPISDLRYGNNERYKWCPSVIFNDTYTNKHRAYTKNIMYIE